jgi:hypothetical protein
MSKLGSKGDSSHLALSLTLVIRICISGLEDEAWFIREIAAKLVDIIYNRTYETGDTLAIYAEYIVDMLLVDEIDCMENLRASACSAIERIIEWSRNTEHEALLVSKCCVLLLAQSEEWSTADFISTHDQVSTVRRIIGYDSYNADQPMYSCGSLMSNGSLRKRHGHSTSDECCSGHNLPGSVKKWQIGDGVLKLFFSLSNLGCLRSKFREIHRIFGKLLVSLCSDGVEMISTVRETILKGLSLVNVVHNLRSNIIPAEYEILEKWIERKSFVCNFKSV